MFTMQCNRIHLFAEQEVELEESQAQKFLRLAEELPTSRPQLETEAARLETLLDSLPAPLSSQGGQLMAQLVEVLEGQIDGIYGLLDGDDETFYESETLLMECDGKLRQLEAHLEDLREQVPLIG